MRARLLCLVASVALLGINLSAPASAQVDFVLSGPYTVASGTLRTHVADVNGDLHLDLITSHSTTSQVGVLLGDGTGSFATAPAIETGITAPTVASGDFNGDGASDLVCVRPISTVASVVLSDGAGGFLPPALIAGVNAAVDAVTADFDGDGNLDFAALEQGSSTTPGNVNVFLGDGNGGFTLPGQEFEVGTNPTHLLADDFDGDGSVDLLVANSGIYLLVDGGLSLLLGDGNGGFSPAIDFAAGAPTWLAAGDFDEDGNQDIAAIYALGGGACDVEDRIYLGDGTGQFSLVQSFNVGCGPFGELAGDFDGDGHLDLALTDGGDLVAAFNNAYIASGDGQGTFGPPVAIIPPDLYSLDDPVTADFDENGLPDLAMAAAFDSRVDVYLNQTVPPNADFIRGDALPDGNLDLADPLAVLGYLFLSGNLQCLDAADVNDSGTIDLSDVIALLEYLFVPGSAAPPPPFPDAGPDPTADALGC